MKVLGIDPGYGRCGMAVIERIERSDTLVESVCVETLPSLPFNERLIEVANECARLIEIHQPTYVVLEKLYFKNNQKTAMQVSEVRGALLTIAANKGILVSEYTPLQVKSAIVGSGRADKKQVARMLHLLMKIDKTISRDDEYDAIAIALTHFAHLRTPLR